MAIVQSVFTRMRVVVLLSALILIHSGTSPFAHADATDGSQPVAVFSLISANEDYAVQAAIGGRQHAISIDFAPFRSGSADFSRLRFNFLDEDVVIERRNRQQGIGRGMVWYGRPADSEGTIILSIAGDVAFGRIELGNKVYKIDPIPGNGNHRIYELDPSRAMPIDAGGLVPGHFDYSSEPLSAPGPQAASRAADDGGILDLLIVYTNGFAAKYPGDQLDAIINFTVGVENAAYDNSLIDLRARVVARHQVTYKDGGSLNPPLNAITNGTGVFSDVLTWRNDAGADVVALLRVFDGISDPNDACGLAWLMTSLNPQFERYAYSVNQVGSSGGYYCTDQTFAHEVGHNLGHHHNYENAETGVYTYSRGMEFPQPSGQIYNTVMSYDLTGTSKVSHFSNPNVQYMGYTTGITNLADAGLSHNNVKLTATQWRSTVPLFADVPTSYFAWQWIEGLSRSGVTAGCGGDNYCPDSFVNRAQMAVFLEKGINGDSFIPPTASGTLFNDVAIGDFAADWIEQLANDGITGGCGNGNYCPDDNVTRSQMAIFLLRAMYGSGYTPPPSSCSTFADAPPGSFACAWIEQLVAEGITAGCGGNNYCPDDSVTRGQMAIFLVRAFDLPY